jgi:hypothetical protein
MNIMTTPRSARMRLSGDLDYESVDGLVNSVWQVLDQHVDLANLLDQATSGESGVR